MKTFVKNTLLLTGLVVLDQLLKLFFEQTQAFINLGFTSLHYVTNTGASFGMLQGNNPMLAWISLIVLGIIMMNADKIDKKQALPTLMIVAGLLGNLIDRVFRGFVIDFFDLKFWPVFNLADSLIVIGVVWLIILAVKKDSQENKKSNKPRRRLRRTKKI
jgi:signal peptidase II